MISSLYSTFKPKLYLILKQVNKKITELKGNVANSGTYPTLFIKHFQTRDSTFRNLSRIHIQLNSIRVEINHMHRDLQCSLVLEASCCFNSLSMVA